MGRVSVWSGINHGDFTVRSLPVPRTGCEELCSRSNVRGRGSRTSQNIQGWVGFVLFNDIWSQEGHLVSCMTIHGGT